MAVAFLSGLLVWSAVPLAALAGNEQLLEAAESKLLGHSNSSLNEEQRLEQLETALYGKPKRGDQEKRLQSVADLLSVKATPVEAKPVEQATVPLKGSVSASKIGESRALLQQGLEANAQGRYAEAEQKFNEAIAIDNRNPDGFYNLGALAEKRGEPKQALNYYEAALRLSPQDPELQAAVHAVQARVYEGQNPIASVNERGMPERNVTQPRTFNLSSTKTGAVGGASATAAKPKTQGFGATLMGVAKYTPLHCPICEVLSVTRMLRGF